MKRTHGQLLRHYQGRLPPWITSGLVASSTSTGQSLLPMMRFAPVLGNRCCQTLSGVLVCRSLAVSTEQIHARTTTELCSLHCGQTPLQTGDEGLAVADNRGSERRRPTCVQWILAWRRQSDAAGHSGMARLVHATATLTSCWKKKNKIECYISHYVVFFLFLNALFIQQVDTILMRCGQIGNENTWSSQRAVKTNNSGSSILCTAWQRSGTKCPRTECQSLFCNIHAIGSRCATWSYKYTAADRHL